MVTGEATQDAPTDAACIGGDQRLPQSQPSLAPFPAYGIAINEWRMETNAKLEETTAAFWATTLQVGR